LSWRRFCRVPLGERMPHPTTLMKTTTRCGEETIAALNEALLAKAVAAHVVKSDKVRADTTVVEANVAYPTDSGLMAKGVARMAGMVKALHGIGLATRTKARDRPVHAPSGPCHRSLAATPERGGQGHRPTPTTTPVPVRRLSPGPRRPHRPHHRSLLQVEVARRASPVPAGRGIGRRGNSLIPVRAFGGDLFRCDRAGSGLPSLIGTTKGRSMRRGHVTAVLAGTSPHPAPSPPPD
jgi:hypothetical protein